ncbi:MAG: acyl-CoA synthetase, partial [Amylibacter sp.]
LPKTAVGKIFKPDLRKAAITRIYNAALVDAGLDVHVSKVIESKKRGLVAQLGKSDKNIKDAQVTKVLGSFIRPWEWAE